MALLSRTPGRTSRAPGDPLAEQVQAAASRGDAAAVDRLLAEAGSDWDRCDRPVAVAVEEPQSRWTQAWVDAAPDSATACTLVAAAACGRAWLARGHGRGHEVTEAQAEGWFGQLERVEELLSRAVRRDAADPTPWAHALLTARGLSLPDEERRERPAGPAGREPAVERLARRPARPRGGGDLGRAAEQAARRLREELDRLCEDGPSQGTLQAVLAVGARHRAEAGAGGACASVCAVDALLGEPVRSLAQGDADARSVRPEDVREVLRRGATALWALPPGSRPLHLAPVDLWSPDRVDGPRLLPSAGYADSTTRDACRQAAGEDVLFGLVVLVVALPLTGLLVRDYARARTSATTSATPS